MRRVLLLLALLAAPALPGPRGGPGPPVQSLVVMELGPMAARPRMPVAIATMCSLLGWPPPCPFSRSEWGVQIPGVPLASITRPMLYGGHVLWWITAATPIPALEAVVLVPGMSPHRVVAQRWWNL